MANTYTQIYIQFVFAVSDRGSLIYPEWKDELYKYITGIVRECGHTLIAINGTQNHIHILVGFIPRQSPAEFMKAVKASSSKWINEKKFTRTRFSWQIGYGAFSYSASHVDRVVTYIKNQEEHHRKRTFLEEYEMFLKMYNIPYERPYVFVDVE